MDAQTRLKMFRGMLNRVRVLEKRPEDDPARRILPYYRAEIERTLRAVETLPEPECRIVTLRYLRPRMWTWCRIALTINYSPSSCFRHHNAALGMLDRYFEAAP